MQQGDHVGQSRRRLCPVLGGLCPAYYKNRTQAQGAQAGRRERGSTGGSAGGGEGEVITFMLYKQTQSKITIKFHLQLKLAKIHNIKI